MPGWCDEVVNYFPATECNEVFYSSYTMQICQQLPLLLFKEWHIILFICV